MNNVIQIFLLIFLVAFSSCNKIEDKTPLLTASQNFNDLNYVKRVLTIYKDSSYVFIETKNEVNHNKIEKWEGNLKIKKDTITFPLGLDYNKSETAVLKNGFIEFLDGEYPDRMKISQTSLLVKNNINLKKINNYAVFTFYKNHHNSAWEKDFSNYDLNTAELLQIDSIFKEEFKNNKKVRKYSDYLKQILAVRNSKNEIIVQSHFFCKTKSLLESYEYYETNMMDGGDCNVYIELNLTTKRITFVKIAGLA